MVEHYKKWQSLCRRRNEMDNFDKDQIKKAIDKFQKEHPQMVWHDVTQIKDEKYIDTISSQIEIIARKLQEDTDMYIVCEMAKMYLEGARPVYPVKPTGEWIETKHRLNLLIGVLYSNQLISESDLKYIEDSIKKLMKCDEKMERSEEE
jgi:hypothetical protein